MLAIRSLKRRAAAAGTALVAACLWHVSAGATSGIAITFPSTLSAGPDFATDVLKDPWDFLNAEDLGLDPAETVGWANPATVFDPAHPGMVGGIASTSDAQIGLLYTGFFTSANPGKEGINTPIDTSKYQKVSFRMSSNVSGEQPQLYWFHTAFEDPADAANAPNFDRNLGAAATGAFAVTNSGTQTFVADLSASNPNNQGFSWTAGPVLGLRLDPNNTNASVGKQFLVNWVRLTYNDSVPGAALQTMSWTGGTGNAKVEVLDAAGTTVILTIGTSIAATSVNNWNYGVLPPGSYNLKVTRGANSGMQAFTINNPPSVLVTDPSRTTGQDYATRVLQHPWDMSSAADVVATGSDNLTNVSYNAPNFPGMLTATNTSNDPNVTLLHNINNQGGALAIDSAKYKYLTFRMQIDGAYDLYYGSVARLFWASSQFLSGATATTTKDIFVFPGMNSYTLDLSRLTSAPGGGLEPSGAQEPWTTNRKTHLRFDPHEFGTVPGDPTPQRTFHLDDVKLTADPVSFGSFTIKYATADADNDPLTVSLFYDTDRDPTNGVTPVPGASGLPGSATGSFVWDTRGVPPGTYYIYAQATDGLTANGKDTRGSYSEAPLVISAPCSFSIAPTTGTVPNGGGTGSVGVTTGANCDWNASSNAAFITITSSPIQTGPASITYAVAANPARTVRSGTLTVAGQSFPVTQSATHAPSDFDGDGIADRTVFRPSNGTWYTRLGATRQYGLPGDVPVVGDYDGNGTLDTAVYRPSIGQWFIQNQPVITWGRPGDVPVPGDYDGDGKTDAAVFRTSDDDTGTWQVLGVAGFPRTWGLRGDVPVPGDYDGDGKLDLAIFRPRTGQWFINYSLNNYANNTNVSWGAPGDIAVPGDYDGDGRTDVAVFRPSTAQWFITYAATNFTTYGVYTWGASGDIPMALDMDGDRADDLTVYRPGDGMWWTYNRVTSTFSSQQWGLPGDVPIGARPQIAAVQPTDFDGDSRVDINVYRPSTGQWFTLFSSGAAAKATQWGLSGDTTVPGDYDGDRRADYAVYRPSTGDWFILLSSTGFASSRQIQWGLPGDIPVPGDYDGDCLTDVAVFRPSNGTWYVLTSSSNFTTYTTAQWGLSGDTPVAADYDGDGRLDLAVYRPSSATWFIRFSSGGFGGSFVRQFGLSSDIPVPADYDGDGRADIAIYRPSTGFWIAADIATTKQPVNAPWGAAAGDIPVRGDFDGDGIAELTVYRPSTGAWIIRLSSGGSSSTAWGQPGDQPIKR